MDILIIGAKGFIGHHAYSYFSALSDCECWACDVLIDTVDDHYICIESCESDFNLLFDKRHFDVCINCSGAANVAESLANPIKDFTLNVVNVVKVLEALRIHLPDCKFINLSSAAVYGNPLTLPIRTESSLRPLSPYGWHKLFSEQLCKEYHECFGLKTLSLRVFSAYGPGLRKQLFWDLFQKARFSEVVSIYGTGNESRDFIHVDDLVQVLKLAIRSADFNGSVVNVANGVEFFLKDIASIYLGFLDKTFVFTGEFKQGDPLNWAADITTIKNWGYENKVPLPQGLKGYIEWAKEFG